MIIVVSVNIAYRVGRSQGATATQTIDNATNSSINQSGNDISYEVVLKEGYITHAVTSSGRKIQHDTIEAELAREIGLECMRKGLIHYSYIDNDWTSPTHIKYDKVTAIISVKEYHG